MDTQIIIPRRNCGDIIGARDSKSRSITFAQATWAFDELKFRDNAAIDAAIDLSWPEKLLARTDVEVLHSVELITYYSWWRIGEWKNVIVEVVVGTSLAIFYFYSSLLSRITLEFNF